MAMELNQDRRQKVEAMTREANEYEERLAALEAKISNIEEPDWVQDLRRTLEEAERRLDETEAGIAELEPEVPKLRESVTPYKQALDKAIVEHKKASERAAGAEFQLNNLRSQRHDLIYNQIWPAKRKLESYR